VSGARVSATHRDTGTTREVSTNEKGDFVITNLATGVYDIKVSATGFEERTVSQIRLQVGQASNLDISLAIGIKAVVLADDFGAGYDLVNTRNGVVDGVIRDLEVQNMPLNGRNFLELALLVPGNTPAPNFDPTKTNTLVISSAGQLGRGGNVTIDGADNNDDVVGGPVQNISQDAVGEFQIATNRFSAELGRSGSAVINVVTKAGTNEFHGLASGFFRDSALQGLPATFDRTLQDEPPFDRQQYSFALGGPIKRDKAWFFSSFEYRNQDGAVLVGTRDLATRSIRKGFATAPLNDLLNTNRVDFSFGDKDQLSVRYSLQRENDVAASSLIRAIGSASERQASENNTHSVVGRWSHIISPTTLNTFSFSYSHFFNDIEPVTPGPQLTFPSIQDGASFRVPQGTKQRRVQLTDSLSYVHGNHTFNFGGELQFVRGDFDLRVFQQGRIELIEDFPDFDRNGDGRVDDNDLLFAVTLRSGVPDR
ncbi:MAG TPA: carboxypeptidase-like regulatory domain-containing protein, partial [Pyrinomonadaceae bacterium]